MCLENDFTPMVAKVMQEELQHYQEKCIYDKARKKIIYYRTEDALTAYMEMQVKNIENYKWLESEKAHHDLGEPCSLAWIAKFSEKFRGYWVLTHIFVPTKD